jgi:PAS domain S-box-containing protein
MLKGIRDFCPVPMMTKEGYLVPVETRVTQGEWNGKPVMFGVSKDISALKLSEEKFSAAFHSTAVLMALSTKTDGKFVDVNEAFLETLGFSRKEVIGKSALELGLFVQRVDRTEAIRKLEDTGRVRGLEIPFRTKDGSIRNGLFSIDSLMIGGVPCLLTTLTDITDRKRAEDALADRLVFQQALIDSIPYPVFIKDATARFVGCNRAYEQEFGTTRDYMLGKTVLDLEYLPSMERQRFHTEDMEVIATAGRSSYELPIVYADGLTHMTLYSVDGFRLADGRPGGLIGMLVDITDRKRAEEILHQTNKKLTLLSGITRHDINNQLTVIMGYLTILENQLSDSSFADYFSKITIAAQRISSMIQFTKEYEQIGVNAPLWNDCRTLVETTIKQAPLGKVMVKNDLPCGTEVFADPLIIKVFYNLMDNAARYGGKITTIRFSVDERDGNQIIVCEDDGDGVPSDEKERIFDRGFGKNTGLGLALSREILSITGITISERGEPGNGGRFEIMVPNEAFRIANMK